MDAVEATLTRDHRELTWEREAKTLLDRFLEKQPVLVRISAAKRLRDNAERQARAAGLTVVEAEHLDPEARTKPGTQT
jgi:chlorophyllide a reductase subunit Z